MSSYVVLARKWRPAQFSDIVGQAPIVRTLINAIESQRIHQAYLFTGSRGVGKTSIARIFSKVIRCECWTSAHQMLRSCDQCSHCREIIQGNSVDVIEIDGASNNGVEAVREIRENARYMPSSGSKKIYIVDEVHMLTTAAFNALLKTLEEPPAHVIFIFATTEPHKIPATILSRCQRFDYRRVTAAQIQSRLQEVAQAEGIQAEPGSLALIARSAEGSMRDALSLLDQVIAFSGQGISVQSVRESIGLLPGQIVIGTLSAVFQRNALKALEGVDQAYQQGHDLRVMARSLIEFLHAILLIRVGAPRSTSLELSNEEWEELQSLSKWRSLEEMELIFQVFHQGMEWIARSPQPKMVLDVLLIKCATAEALIQISTSEASSQPQQERPSSPDSSRAASASTQPPIQTPSDSSTKNSPKNWEGFIEYVRKSRPLLASMLEHSSGMTASSLDFDSTSPEKSLTLSFSPQENYFKEQLGSRIYQEQLNSFSKEYFGTVIRFQIELRAGGESLAARREREQKQRLESLKEKAQNHPILLEAKNLFGGELGPIHIQETN